MKYMYLLVLASFLVNHQTECATRMNARDRLTKASRPPIGYSIKQPPELSDERRSKRSVDGSPLRTEGFAEEVLGLDGEERFQIIREMKTVHGVKVRKMKEQFKDRDVFDTIITVKVDDDNETILDASGTVVQDIGTDIPQFEHELSEEDLYNVLIKENKDENIIDYIGGRNIVYDVTIDDNGTAIPVAIVEYLVETEGIVKRPMALIKTKTGEIIKAWDNLQTCFPEERHRLFGGNVKVGKMEFGIIPQCLELRKEDNMCYLENDLVRVVDMGHTENDNVTETASFPCDETYNDTINGAFSPALDALYLGTQIQRMFLDWYGEKLVKDLVMRVHFGKNHINAFWNGKNVTFGDGRKKFVHPFVVLDIAAHEIAHGYSELTSGLLYVSQTGGVNEAFADMTGEIAELYLDVIDWRVGYAIMYRNISMRYLDDPSKNHRSINHLSKYKEGMGPHGCSGIFNHAFYLLCNVHSDDPREVYGAFLHANRMYWHPLTNFTDGACDVMKSVYDMGLNPEHYAKAFRDVGIEPCDMKDHILHLKHNRTRPGVTVSSKINPVFGIEVPDWAASLYIQGTNPGNVDIKIEIIAETWDRITKDVVPLNEDYNYVEHNVTKLENKYFLVRLSSKSRTPMTDVSVRAGYFCLDEYTHKNFLYRAFYSLECFGIDLWAQKAN